MKKKRWE